MPQQAIPFSDLQQSLNAAAKSDPLFQRTIEVPVNRMKPPTVIPLNSLPPSVAPMFHSLVFSPLPTQPPTGMVPNVKSWPPAGSSRLPQLPSWPMAASIRYQQAPMRIAQFTRTVTPEDGDNYKDSEGPEGGLPDQNNRRREMNRLAQQKSRLRKDQLRASLQSDNDGLRAKIVYLEAEVSVWKHMTKKSENEANELRRKVEEWEAKNRSLVQEGKNLTKKSENETAEWRRKLEKSEAKSKDEAAELRREVRREIEQLEANIQALERTNKGKENELLTQELHRMYQLSNQQADAHKLLYQALEDQRQRMTLLEKRKNDKSEFCSGPSQTGNPLWKAGIRWKRRMNRGRIAKRNIAARLKKSRNESFVNEE